jgi:hypothetical protein
MQDKQKVTLYLPIDLHRQLKIRAAVDAEPMSVLAERAICFYLSHSEVVENLDTHGETHRIYHCPTCETPVVLRSGEMQAIEQSSNVVPDELVDLSQLDEGLLVPC